MQFVRSSVCVCVYLLCEPADVFELCVCVGGAQVGVDVCECVWQQCSRVRVYGGEPGVCSGRVLTAQNHQVLAVRRMQLQQPSHTHTHTLKEHVLH